MFVSLKLGLQCNKIQNQAAAVLAPLQRPITFQTNLYKFRRTTYFC